MATNTKLHFFISKCPGAFRVTAGWVHMLEKHENHLIFDLTVKPTEAGIELLGHDREFKISFEVTLMGATTKYGHGVEEPRNVRLLGRFLITQGLQPHTIDPKAAPILAVWQWEVVFNPINRKGGFVGKLDNPLPENWTC